MPQYKLVIVGLLVFLLAACTNPTIPDPEPTEPVGSDDPVTDTYDDASMGEGEDVTYDPSAGELSHIIYFDFDSSELRPEDTDTVARHATQLAQNGGMRVRLEGHADERGSREYNRGRAL